MKNSNSRSIMYATTISENPTKYIKSMSEIAKQVAYYSKIHCEKLNIEYEASDSTVFFNITFTADSAEAGDNFFEDLSNAISDLFFDIPHLEIREVIHD